MFLPKESFRLGLGVAILYKRSVNVKLYIHVYIKAVHHLIVGKNIVYKYMDIWFNSTREEAADIVL